MRLPARIVVPIAGAVFLIGLLLIVLFWQLEGARAFLQGQIANFTESGAVADVGGVSYDDAGDAALLHLRKGDIFALRSEWAEAVHEYEEAVKADGGITALRKLAQAQLQRRDVKGAQATLDQMRREGARGEDVLLLESIILIRTGEVAKARQLLITSEESPHKHYGLALLAIISNDHIAAKQELASVVGGWEPVLRSYARMLLSAYEEYDLFPESPELHLLTLLSRSLAQVQECELALPLLSKVTNAQDDYRDAWIVQGFCELTSERNAEALASLEQAYGIDPEKPETQYFLSRAYINQGNHTQAVTFLQYALRNGFEPQSEVRRLLAQEALEIGNASLAFEQYEAMTKQEDATIDMYTAYVTAALTAKKNQEAIVKAQEAVQKWPESADAYELLGWAQAEADQKEEARASLQKAIELNPNVQSAKEKLNDL